MSTYSHVSANKDSQTVLILHLFTMCATLTPDYGVRVREPALPSIHLLKTGENVDENEHKEKTITIESHMSWKSSYFTDVAFSSVWEKYISG